MGRLANDALPSISTQWPHHLKYKSKQGPPTTNPCFFWSNSIVSICLSNLFRTVKKHEIHTRNQKHTSAFCIVIERNSYRMLNEWPYCLKSLRFGIFCSKPTKGQTKPIWELFSILSDSGDLQCQTSMNEKNALCNLTQTVYRWMSLPMVTASCLHTLTHRGVSMIGLADYTIKDQGTKVQEYCMFWMEPTKVPPHVVWVNSKRPKEIYSSSC